MGKNPPKFAIHQCGHFLLIFAIALLYLYVRKAIEKRLLLAGLNAKENIMIILLVDNLRQHTRSFGNRSMLLNLNNGGDLTFLLNDIQPICKNAESMFGQHLSEIHKPQFIMIIVNTKEHSQRYEISS